jgi:hypothetical protein
MARRAQQNPRVAAIESIDLYRSPLDNCFLTRTATPALFQTATQTLATMSAKFGASSPQVAQWLDAQDQVFDNCGAPPQVSSDPWFKDVDEWNDARKLVPGVLVPPSFNGACAGKKFRAAASDLRRMIQTLGPSRPVVKQKVCDEDRAFVECSKRPKIPPTPTLEIPEPLTVPPASGRSATMQIACANFYSGNFDIAETMFNAIAGYTSSRGACLRLI